MASTKQIETKLEKGFDFKGVSFEMRDKHANYYTATYKGKDYEIKIVNGTNDVYAREEDREDWEYFDELT